MEKYGQGYCDPSVAPYYTLKLEEYREKDLFILPRYVVITPHVYDTLSKFIAAVCERLCYQDDRCILASRTSTGCSLFKEANCILSKTGKAYTTSIKTGLWCLNYLSPFK